MWMSLRWSQATLPRHLPLLSHSGIEDQHHKESAVQAGPRLQGAGRPHLSLTQELPGLEVRVLTQSEAVCVCPGSLGLHVAWSVCCYCPVHILPGVLGDPCSGSILLACPLGPLSEAWGSLWSLR